MQLNFSAYLGALMSFSDSALRVGCVLAAHAAQQLPHNRIAQLAGISDRQVRRALAELTESRVIAVEREKPGTPARYRINGFNVREDILRTPVSGVIETPDMGVRGQFATPDIGVRGVTETPDMGVRRSKSISDACAGTRVPNSVLILNTNTKAAAAEEKTAAAAAFVRWNPVGSDPLSRSFIALGIPLVGEHPAIHALAERNTQGALKAAYLAALRSLELPAVLNSGRVIGSIRERWGRWTVTETRAALIAAGVTRVELLDSMQWTTCPAEIAAAADHAQRLKAQRAKTKHPITRSASLIAVLINDGESWALAVEAARAARRNPNASAAASSGPAAAPAAAAADEAAAEEEARKQIDQYSDPKRVADITARILAQSTALVRRVIEKLPPDERPRHRLIVEKVAAALKEIP
jgi:hypothetical protein